MAEKIASAYVEIAADTKKLDKAFDKTKQDLVKNATQASGLVRKRFVSMLRAGEQVASEISSRFKIAFAGMVGVAGLAVRQYLKSIEKTAAGRAWEKTKKQLGESVARLGRLVWESKIFGNTIDGWTKSLTRFLDGLSRQDVQKFIKTAETFGKLFAGSSALLMISKLTSGITDLIDKVIDLTAVTAASPLLRGLGSAAGSAAGAAAGPSIAKKFMEGGASKSDGLSAAGQLALLPLYTRATKFGFKNKPMGEGRSISDNYQKTLHTDKKAFRDFLANRERRRIQRSGASEAMAFLGGTTAKKAASSSVVVGGFGGETAKQIAKENKWEQNKELMKKNKDRLIFSDEKGYNYSLDTKHGRFEITNPKGKHLGEVDFSGAITKKADLSGKHDLIVK